MMVGMNKNHKNSSESGITSLEVVEYGAKLTTRLAEKYGGQMTLNQLRVIHSVLLCYLRNGSEFPCTVKWIHENTDIPLSTISRSLAGLVDNGWVADEIHPDDGRSRIIRLGPKSAKTPIDLRILGDWLLDRR